MKSADFGIGFLKNLGILRFLCERVFWGLVIV